MAQSFHHTVAPQAPPLAQRRQAAHMHKLGPPQNLTPNPKPSQPFTAAPAYYNRGLTTCR